MNPAFQESGYTQHHLYVSSVVHAKYTWPWVYCPHRWQDNMLFKDWTFTLYCGVQWGGIPNHWCEPHRCISPHRRSWGIQTPPRQSRSSLSPLSVAACPRLAWCSPPCSGSCDLQSNCVYVFTLQLQWRCLKHENHWKARTFIFNNDAGVHFGMYTVHQDHESQVFVDLIETKEQGSE